MGSGVDPTVPSPAGEPPAPDPAPAVELGSGQIRRRLSLTLAAQSPAEIESFIRDRLSAICVEDLTRVPAFCKEVTDGLALRGDTKAYYHKLSFVMGSILGREAEASKPTSAEQQNTLAGLSYAAELILTSTLARLDCEAAETLNVLVNSCLRILRRQLDVPPTAIEPGIEGSLFVILVRCDVAIHRLKITEQIPVLHQAGLDDLGQLFNQLLDVERVSPDTEIALSFVSDAVLAARHFTLGNTIRRISQITRQILSDLIQQEPVRDLVEDRSLQDAMHNTCADCLDALAKIQQGPRLRSFWTWAYNSAPVLYRPLVIVGMGRVDPEIAVAWAWDLLPMLVDRATNDAASLLYDLLQIPGCHQPLRRCLLDLPADSHDAFIACIRAHLDQDPTFDSEGCIEGFFRALGRAPGNEEDRRSA